MKTLALLLLLSGSVWAVKCPQGMSEWKGECTYDLVPELAKPVQPSDEKPPKSGMPSYQAPDVSLAKVTNTAAEDERLDQEKRDADAEGKRAAGLSK